MKTAMQELIEQLNNVKPTQFCSIETIRGWAESSLKKEKEQLQDAYWEGGQDIPLHISSVEQWYNETFNTNEK